MEEFLAPEHARVGRCLQDDANDENTMRGLAAIIILALASPGAAPASPYERDEEEEGHYTSPTYQYFRTREAAEAAMQRESQGPKSVPGLGRMVQLPTGLTGFEHRARFQKAPVLSVTEPVGAQRPSDYDVMFAKAMRVHHQMALDMSHAYNNDPNGENQVIREINRGILRDQAIEIGILSDLIGQCPGDPDPIEIPPEMHEMMGMPHGVSHGG